MINVGLHSCKWGLDPNFYCIVPIIFLQIVVISSYIE